MGSFKGLEIINCSAQTDLSTENTSPAYAPFIEGFELKYMPEVNETRLVNDNGGNQLAIKGNAHYEFDGDEHIWCEADSGESIVNPVCDSRLLACGFSAANTTVRTYSPCFEGDYTNVTMYGYGGSKTNGDCNASKAKHMMFEGSIVGKVGDPLKLRLHGLGVVSAIPTPGNYPSVTMLDDAIPTLTMSASTICGIAYKISEFEIKFGYTVALLMDGSTNGYVRAQLVPGPAKFTCKALMEDMATKTPYTSLVAGTNGTLSIVTGSGSSIVTIAATGSTAQFLSVTETDDNGIKMFDIEGQFTNNAYTIVFDGSN